MLHQAPLVAAVAVGFVIAFVLGMIANRLKLSPIVGYLLAGVIVGPYTPGFVADADLAAELAEIGVILLMFGVGLHFSYKDLFAVGRIAIPGALAQIAVATLLGMGLGLLMGWPVSAGLVFGLALSVASTVVLLRALEERRILDTKSGQIAVGWLVVEDIVMIFVLVLLPVFGAVVTGDPAEGGGGIFGGGLLGSLALTFGKLVAFVALMFVVGRRVIPWALGRVAATGSRELFTLSILAIGMGVAYGAGVVFGVSFALGAFFAGMMLKESELSAQAAADTLPLRDAFAVLFFVSVGMLFNPAILIEEPLAVLATLLIITAGKSVAAFVIVKAFRYPSDTALLISASLAQIGEFSFILATLGLSLNLLPETGRDLVVAGAALSIVANPFVFALAVYLRRLRRRRIAADAAAEGASEAAHEPHRAAATDHVIVVGFGRVGKRVAATLMERGAAIVVVESDLDRVEDIRRQGRNAIFGNATSSDVLKAAGIEKARHLLVAVPNGIEAGEIVARARALNPSLRIVARANLDAEMEHLLARGADRVVMGEREIARLMISDVAQGT